MKNFILSVIILILLIFSCGNEKLNNYEINNLYNELEELENKIKKEFQIINDLVLDVSNFTSRLYNKQVRNINKKDIFDINENGVLYKKRNDGGAAVFVSGYHKVDEKIINIVNLTEPLDSVFKAIMEYSYKNLDTNIVQIYYNDRHSYHRIYPFLDVIVQYEPNIDITKFNFYYLADKNHNPEKKVVWIYEPYLDPAGRGWMISCIAPVYHNDTLQGVLGVDIIIRKLISKFLKDKYNNVIIINKNGTLVASNNYISNLLYLPTSEGDGYFGTITENTYRPQSHKVINHKIKEFREYFIKSSSEEIKYHYINYNGQGYHFIANMIPEFDWFLIKIIISN